MTTRRERVLSALFEVVSGLSGATVERNAELPERIPSGGYIVQRDGEAVEPEEVVLSPLSYLYAEPVEIEVAVQAADGREAALDALLKQLGTALAADRTLGGLADDLRAGLPGLSDVEAAPPIKTATVTVLITYSTPDPLQ